jgi:hypothetical protein
MSAVFSTQLWNILSSIVELELLCLKYLHGSLYVNKVHLRFLGRPYGSNTENLVHALIVPNMLPLGLLVIVVAGLVLSTCAQTEHGIRG